MTQPFTISSAPLPSYKENFVRISLLKREGDPLSDYIWVNWKAGEPLSADLIKREVPDYKDASFYLAGGSGFYERIDAELDVLGIARRRRRREYLGESSRIETHKDFPPGAAGKTWKLTLQLGFDQREIEAKSTDTLAQSLEKAALGIDTRCRSGECGWCRSRLIKGHVWQRPSMEISNSKRLRAARPLQDQSPRSTAPAL